MQTAPFLGKGTGFPFRINPSTGGVEVTEGNYDSISVAVQYLAERWTIRESVDELVNHIAESIHHILFTVPTEHDTLPEFGSRLINMIFEPNTMEFRIIAETFMEQSTLRWEKRAKYPDTAPDALYPGVFWYSEGLLTDEGRIRCWARIQFIVQQAPENLVTPFVTPRESRLQEYKSSKVDSNAHDLFSRYYNESEMNRGDFKFLRVKRPIPFPMARDDIFYKVNPTDTWLLISWFTYQDIRYWWVPAQIFAYDTSRLGGSREALDITGNPAPGTLLRMPSRSRLLVNMSSGRSSYQDGYLIY
jgi:phage baseplate assembly protein W